MFVESGRVVEAIPGSRIQGPLLKLEVAGPQDLAQVDAPLYGSCDVYDSQGVHRYSAALVLPYDYERKVIETESHVGDGRFRYTLHAFPRLEVVSERPNDATNWSYERLPLADVEYSSVKCYVAEVTKVLPLRRKPRYWEIPKELLTKVSTANRIE